MRVLGVFSVAVYDIQRWITAHARDEVLESGRAGAHGLTVAGDIMDVNCATRIVTRGACLMALVTPNSPARIGAARGTLVESGLKWGLDRSGTARARIEAL